MKRPRIVDPAAPAGPRDQPTFYLYNPVDKHSATFEVEQYGGHPEDDAFYVLQFHRPGVKNIHLYTLYIVGRDGDACLYAHSLREPTQPLSERVLMDRKYVVYETYALAQDTEDAGITFALYVNVQQEKRVRVDMAVGWLRNRVPRFRNHLQFHPWDVDVTQYGLKLDTRTIPQRTPLWFKNRGEVTGTKAYTLLGYFVPSKEEDPHWTVDGEKTFSAAQKRAMQFGVESEDKALMLYAHHFPHVEIEVVGLCRALPGGGNGGPAAPEGGGGATTGATVGRTESPRPAAGGIPYGWGASPDAILHDPHHTWDDIPRKIRDYWNEEEWKSRASHGVLEIKSTLNASKLSMEPYFFPQVYMEMISTQTLWTDVVRYSTRGARVYRVYRHRPTEETLVSLIKYARNNADRLRDIMNEESFVKIRDYFARLSFTMPYVELEATPSYARLRSEYEAYELAKQSEGQQLRVSELEVWRMKKQKGVAPLVVAPREARSDEAAGEGVVSPRGAGGNDTTLKSQLDHILSNHHTLYATANDATRFKTLICKQIELYTSILRSQ